MVHAATALAAAHRLDAWRTAAPQLAPRLAALEHAHTSLLAKLRDEESAITVAATTRVTTSRVKRRSRVRGFYSKERTVLDAVTVRAHATVPDDAIAVNRDVERDSRASSPSFKQANGSQNTNFSFQK